MHVPVQPYVAMNDIDDVVHKRWGGPYLNCDACDFGECPSIAHDGNLRFSVLVRVPKVPWAV